jgi:hypothetical protein
MQSHVIPFEEAYAQFLKQKGDLFERVEVPMDDEDKKEVERLDRFSKKITAPVLLVFGCLAFVGSAYLFYTRNWIPASGILFCSIACAALSIYYKSYYGRLLKDGKKIIIKGIISKIVNSRDYYGLTISEKETIFFIKQQVKGYKAGDIVRCETLSQQEDIKKKIEKIGNIRD